MKFTNVCLLFALTLPGWAGPILKLKVGAEEIDLLHPTSAGFTAAALAAPADDPGGDQFIEYSKTTADYSLNLEFDIGVPPPPPARPGFHVFAIGMNVTNLSSNPLDLSLTFLNSGYPDRVVGFRSLGYFQLTHEFDVRISSAECVSPHPSRALTCEGLFASPDFEADISTTLLPGQSGSIAGRYTVPEPGSLGLIAAGLLCLAISRRARTVKL